MNHQNIIRVTRSQIRRLLEDFRKVSDFPKESDHLDDPEFAGYSLELLNREETERVDRHLASCLECLDEMERLTITGHLDDSEFAGYSLELLNREETERIDRHLASCPECLDEMERLISPTTHAPAAANGSVDVQPAGRLGGHKGRLGNAVDATDPSAATSPLKDGVSSTNPDGEFTMPKEPRSFPPPDLVHQSSEVAETKAVLLPTESPPRRRLRPWVRIGIACASVAVAAFFFSFEWDTFGGPEHQVLTNRAWRAYKAGKYDQAIAAASKCITRFRPTARDMQKDLQTKNSPQPPTGSVKPEGREEVHRNGPLNDVATSYWILGRSLEEQGKKAEAIKALRACAALTYARCWDPDQEIFWDPAKDASGRLDDLESRD
jgi:tetratricopeptide (TPR) repeat protein